MAKAGTRILEGSKLSRLDGWLILSVVLLLAVGLAALYSATHHWAPSLMIRQLVWLGLGSVALMVM
ncbi:MAG: hypothetical protein SNJ72_08860, partial [Fimbriimonadales bacterium]